MNLIAGNKFGMKSRDLLLVAILFSFFFQAEDGIRDLTVTGVQTCALPIFDVAPPRGGRRRNPVTGAVALAARPTAAVVSLAAPRPRPVLSAPGVRRAVLDRKSVV